MRVAIDIRRAGDFGVGTYIRNIINQFARSNDGNEYLLIGQQSHLREFDPLPENFTLLDYHSDPGSFHTHLHLPYLLHKQGVDLLHMPWFYAPAVVPSRLVITIHDLTDILTPPPGISATFQAGRLYFARRALARADRILAVSHSSKRDLSRVFDVPEAKIEVVYNALDERFLREPMPEGADAILERHAVTDPFVLYAGNIKPQKNLPRLIEAFAVAKADLRDDPHYSNLKLLLIGDSAEEHSDLRRAVLRSRSRRRPIFGLRPAPRAARFLFSRQRVPLPLSVRRIRTSSARSHGPRRSRADVERLFAPGSVFTRRAARESRKYL
jgi:glycosyltransferase involved in cell wall biosynthesis